MDSADARRPEERGDQQPQQNNKQQKMQQAKDKQDQANTPLYLSLLVAVAIVSFAVLGTAIAKREAHAAMWAGLEQPSATEAAPAYGAPAGSPLALLTRGVARGVTTAASKLDSGDAMAAAVATDGAMRVARLATYAASGPARSAFEEASRAIDESRRARQDGNGGKAAAALARAARAVSATDSTTTASAPVPGAGDSDYDGARLLNAEGVMIGVVDHVSVSSGAPATATIVVGGYHHVLGFMDFGGTHIDVPIQRLIFGEPHKLGPTEVALSSFARTADEVRHGRVSGPRS